MLKPHRLLLTAILLLLTGNVCFSQKDKETATYDDKVLFGGCWFVPHNSQISITFSGYSDFQLHDIDANALEAVSTGKYLLDGHNLWLIYNNKPRQKFYFYKTEGADAHFVIRGYPLETSNYYFVHGDCQ